MGRNDLCFCGSGKKIKKCHPDINEQSIAARLLRLYNEIDHSVDIYYQNTNHTAPCSKGCAECCYSDFPLSDIEFNLIIYEIRKWNRTEIESLIQRATILWERVNEKYPDFSEEN